MSKDWIVLTSRSGVKRYVQVKHVSLSARIRTDTPSSALAADQDPIQVRETPEEICALLGIPNDGGSTTCDPAHDIARNADLKPIE
jgi:hypothetical protein